MLHKMKLAGIKSDKYSGARLFKIL
jgi:hypothetical protein